MKRVRGETGVSVIEVMVVGSVMLVLLGAALGIINEMMHQYTFQSRLMAAQDEARRGLVGLSRNIRAAERPLLLPLAVPTNDFRFAADVDGDGSSEAVRYYLDTNGQRVVHQQSETTPVDDWTTIPGTTAVANVVNDPTTEPLFTLAYLDVLNQYNVRSVTIRLKVDTNPGSPPNAVDMWTDVELRNFAQYE